MYQYNEDDFYQSFKQQRHRNKECFQLTAFFVKFLTCKEFFYQFFFILHGYLQRMRILFDLTQDNRLNLMPLTKLFDNILYDLVKHETCFNRQVQ